MIEQRNRLWWFKLNGLMRYIMVHCAAGFFPLYIVNEYPKSGGSWLAQMLSDALKVPFPRNRLPMAKCCIMHGHYYRSWNMKNVVFMWRDGRDVLVSQYFHYLFDRKSSNAATVQKYRSQLDFSDYNDVKNNLPKFIDFVFNKKSHQKHNWTQFVNKWADKDNIVHVKYEALRINTAETFQTVLFDLTGKHLQEERAKTIAEKYSFEQQSNRKAGQENRHSYLRKGIVGDWRNYFSKSSRKLFCECAGDELIKLGYEKDH